MALVLAADLAGAREAQRIQLMIEYAPEPPFDASSPATALPELVSELRARRPDVQAHQVHPRADQ